MGLEVVATGSWVYDGIAESPVWIVRADFDFWYELAAADGELEPGETPQLNDDGVTYYVAFREPGDGRFWPMRVAFRRSMKRSARQLVRCPQPSSGTRADLPFEAIAATAHSGAACRFSTASD